MNRSIVIPIAILLFIVLDYYCYNAIKTAFHDSTESNKRIASIVYWGISAITFLMLITMGIFNGDKLSSITRNFWITTIVGNLIVKLFLSIFLLLEDISRFIRWAIGKISLLSTEVPISTPIDVSRAEFLSQTALAVAAIPAISMGYGIISGAHDYKIRRIQVPLKNLPSSFDGLRIVQVSDIHSGSFFNKTAVKGGIEMILKEKPDAIFFTGDLVNNEAIEMNNWVNVFEKLKAPLGVFSTLGNHDYGDYKQWESLAAKKQNVQDLIRIHKNMGWDILMNEHRFLTQGADKLAILGVENWGKGERWPKYGKLDQAYKGAEEAPVKILLSHDPSHWDAQVRPQYPDIDLMLAGHTHGFQFGIEVGDFRWSPVQYVYKQWAGMYQENNQRLYVNRGFGYIGFPGRVGMPPEITVLELKKA